MTRIGPGHGRPCPGRDQSCRRRRTPAALGTLFLLVGVGWLVSPLGEGRPPQTAGAALPSPGALSLLTRRIVEGARKDLGSRYDPRYVVLPYPNGDVPRGQGACSDVVIRALRNAGYDLQRLMHEDLRQHLSAYPLDQWNQTEPDPNIDHRRTRNQMAFFRRHGHSLTLHLTDPAAWQPGDLVYWRLDSGLLHTGVLSDHRNPEGLPLVIHNLGVCVEQDCLTRWKIIAHFRFPA